MVGQGTAKRRWTSRITLAAVGILIGLAVAASPPSSEGARAQQPAPATQLAQLSAERPYDIAAQPLTTALTLFGQQSGVQITVHGTLPRDITAPAVRGTMTGDQALTRLLEGTGLTYVVTDDRTIAIEKPGERKSDGATPLDPISIEGETESAYGPVDGYVAKRSATGTKTDTPLIEIPQSVSVISRQQIEDRGVEVESEALLYTAGVYAQPFGDALNAFNNFYYIRGFPTSFGGSFVDGTLSSVNYRYEPYGYERIEVLRGPTSVLYGQGDPGGLINRVSKRPSADSNQEFVFGYNNFDTVQLALDVTGAVDQEGQLLYRFTGIGRTGHAPTEELRFDQELDEDRVYLAPSLTWNITPDTSFTLLTSFQKDDTQELTAFIAPGFDVFNVRLDGNPGTRFDYRDFSVGYAFDHSFDKTLKVSQNFRFSGLDYEYDTLFNDVNAPFDGVNIGRFADGFREKRRDIVTDTRVQKDVSIGITDHTLLGGFDFQRLEDEFTFSFGSATTLNLLNPDYTTPFDANIDFFSEKVTSHNYGLYAQDQIKIDEDWILTLGVRQDWSRVRTEDLLFGGTTKLNESATTYRAGLNYLFDNGVAPYFSYAESFLPTSGVDVNGDPFEPTTGRQFEVGVKYQPEHFPGFFTIAAYDLTKKNVVTPDPNNMSFSVQTGEIRSRGVELQATTELFDSLKIQAAYTYNFSKVTKSNSGNQGDEASLAPRNLASMWVDYAFPPSIADGLSLGGGVRYVGTNFAFDRTMTLTNRVKNDATLLVDAAVRYDLGRFVPFLDKTELAVNVSNLFGTDYQVCYSRFNCTLGEPLIVTGTVTLRR